MLEALERESKVRSTLGRRHHVDLVDDHYFDRRECLGGGRCQHQIQRLRRRYQDVGRILDHVTTLLLSRVTGASRNCQRRDIHVLAPGLDLDSTQRRAQVALDVIGQRFERRDIQAHASGAFVSRHDPCIRKHIDRPQEGRQRLTRTGRRQDEGVVTFADGPPAGRLRRSSAAARSRQTTNALPAKTAPARSPM